MVFLVLFLIPLTFAVGGFILSLIVNDRSKRITGKELGVQLLAALLISGVSAGIVSCAATHDTEVWNGRVVSKRSDHVSCSHSYSCNCHTTCSGSGKNRSCSEHCDTCYEHSYDVDWNVFTSNGEEFEIARVDRQGTSEPARWTSIQMGEPTSQTHGYENFIKASPDSLFRRQGLTGRYAELKVIPVYPQDIYDYYRINRVVGVQMSLVDTAAWNDDLSKINAELGSSKQANMILVLVRDLPQDYFYALEEAWIGGKKNDIILVVGVNGQLEPQWSEVMCWTTNELFKVKLREEIMSVKPLTREGVMATFRRDVQQFYKRKPMKDFEYLKATITPSPLAWAISLIIGLLVQIALSYWFWNEDPFDTASRYRYRY